MNGIDIFLIQYGLLAVFLIMFLKTVGVPIPIPADLIILTAAARVAQGKLVGWQVFCAILLALVLGGYIQFLLARGPGRGLLWRFGRYIGLTKPRIDAVAEKIKKGGIPGLAVVILVPGIRGAAVTAAGLVDMEARRFLSGLTLGSLAFVSLHFFLGYLGGATLSLVQKILPLPTVLILVLACLLVAYVVWVMTIRRRKATLARAAAEQNNAAALEVWHEGICPVCLALSTANRL